MDDATPMMQLFHERAKLIRRGRYNARLPMYMGMKAGPARTKAHKKYLQEAHKAAKRQADMDRSDPFLYGRLRAQLDLGIFSPSELPKTHRVSA